MEKKINPVRATSLLGYCEVLEHLGESQLEVLRCLDSFSSSAIFGGDVSATNLMVARKLDWDINRVTPRMNELVKMRLVVEDKTDNCKVTGRQAIYWRFKKR